MPLKNPFAKPDPRQRKADKLHQAQLDLITSQEFAEYYASQAAMLRGRVERYQNELAEDQPVEAKTGLRLAA